MQEITLKIPPNENIGVLTEEQKNKIQEIFLALISSGGLSGIKGGKTVIHFDGEGNFMGISFDYMVWKRRKSWDIPPVKER